MYTKQEKLNYINKKQNLNNLFENIADDEIDFIFKIECIKDEILENGIDICRISYKDKETEKKIDDYIKLNRCYPFRDKHIKTSFYHGNMCIYGINLITAKRLQKEYDITIDKIYHILSKKDIYRFNRGDKVSFTSVNDFGMTCNSKGTVFEVGKDYITIKAYRSRTKGYKLSIGEEITLKKGW